jgi:hypothetical protein
MAVVANMTACYQHTSLPIPGCRILISEMLEGQVRLFSDCIRECRTYPYLRGRGRDDRIFVLLDMIDYPNVGRNSEPESNQRYNLCAVLLLQQCMLTERVHRNGDRAIIHIVAC